MRDRRVIRPAATLSRRDALRGLGGLALAASAYRVAPGGTGARALRSTPPEPYRFALGAFTVIVVPDGDVTFPNPVFDLPPAQLLFVDAPDAERDAALREAGLEEWVESPQTATVALPVLPLVVETGQQLILLDTGYGLASPIPTAGRLLANLGAAGISPEQIDVVVLSHFHPDHILGAVDGAGRPAFPNARFVTGRGEHAFWTDEAAVAAALPDPAAREGVLAPIRAVLPAIAGRLDLVDDAAEEEIVPGVRAVAAPGHSPGQMAVAIASGGQQLLATFDAFMHPLHVAHSGWNFVADTLPDQADATRRALLDRIAAEEMGVLAYHFPFPGLGRVVRRDAAWLWEPAA